MKSENKKILTDGLLKDSLSTNHISQNSPPKFIGIFREAEHSPERVEDDELIMKAVAERLTEITGEDTRLIFPSEVRKTLDEAGPVLVFNMAEEEPVLSFLNELEQKGIRVVNSTASVRNTFRSQMTSMLSKMPFFPETILCSVSAPPSHDMQSVWVKRGDFHAIEKQDVVFAKDQNEIRKLLDTFRKRNIPDVAIQKHIPGDLIKFYGVRATGQQNGTRWFHWFYHRDQELNNFKFDTADLQKKCELSSDILGLEIYGGDAIVTEDGSIFVIDVNAWPSFALFRDVASKFIAEHLLEKSRG